MSSRYGGDYRRSGDFAYREGPPPPRWDSERFTREREERFRGPPVMERDRIEVERDRYVRGDRFEDRYMVEERFGPPARRPDRRYYEEEEVFERRAPPVADAIIPYRRPEEEPPRPGLIRRRSSFDAFDRPPPRRIPVYEDQRRPPMPIPVPRRFSPPRYGPRYAERDFEEIRVSEPDFYGDEEFRTYREREWTNHRSRRRSNSSEERIVEEEVIEEKPWPRRGKTKIPRAKVHTRAIIELGYPYEEENETIIILKALHKTQIDEVIALSSEYKERDHSTTTTIHLVESSPPKEEIIEKVEKISTVPMSEAPRSVREWDTLKVERRSPSPTGSRRSRSTHHRSHRSRSRRDSSPKTEIVIEKRESIREVSPSRSSRSRHESTIIDRKEIIDIEERDESNSVHAGPLALVLPERRRRSEREIKSEIRALEEERRLLRIERVPREREIIIEREHPEEIVEVRKDKKASPPDPRLIRAMMATLT